MKCCKLLVSSLFCLAASAGISGRKAASKGNATAARGGKQAPDVVFVPWWTIDWPILIPFFVTGTTTTSPPAPTPAPPAGPIRRPYKCEDIKDKFTCLRARPMFGLDCVGFGGDWCIPQIGAKCSDFTSPILCNRARRFGFDCPGWTGKFCIR
mmetsp:Transcript_179466/g.436648  ORF Transcript_179466/g.436648 Transcript_179466/m.436648 type:complete len:153 (-) Transcript_179466:66-524(-)